MKNSLIVLLTRCSWSCQATTPAGYSQLHLAGNQQAGGILASATFQPSIIFRKSATNQPLS